jgi:hypothetical protein
MYGLVVLTSKLALQHVDEIQAIKQLTNQTTQSKGSDTLSQGTYHCVLKFQKGRGYSALALELPLPISKSLTPRKGQYLIKYKDTVMPQCSSSLLTLDAISRRGNCCAISCKWMA